ncbi:DNA replication complex GINS protein PSF3 [Nematolebias whitei]|uniref:DNA replication complex GINS protein PSF3 n=1 Tax=Nematolebias whitei TaxID=451745 RepID=UPI00189750A1|nr:DNA replication complex GINS protein PSF3 [Nematolebias whitei]
MLHQLMIQHPTLFSPLKGFICRPHSSTSAVGRLSPRHAQVLAGRPSRLWIQACLYSPPMALTEERGSSAENEKHKRQMEEEEWMETVQKLDRTATKMELPLWLCKGLYERKRKVLSVELPKVYREGWRTVFTADPNVVDLHKMGPYYYGLGSQMLHFDRPENPDIAKALLQTFVGRFRRTMDSSQNAYNEDTSALVERLDSLEKVLFRSGQNGLNSFQSWEKGRASQLTASSLVLNYRKRKLSDVQT